MDWKFPYKALHKTENDLLSSDLLLKSEYLETSSILVASFCELWPKKKKFHNLLICLYIFKN